MPYVIQRSLLSFLLLIACATCQRPVTQQEGGLASSNCRVVKHDLGTTEICGQPQRIIALDTQALDLLLALGVEPIGYAEDRRALVGSPQLGQSVIGVKYLGDRLTTNPVHIGTSQSPSLETILALKPDLIFGSHLGNTEHQMLQKIAPTVLPLDLATPDQWRKKIQILGQILHREDKASAVLTAHDQQIRQTQTQLVEYQGQLILLLSMSGLESIEVFHQNTFAGKLLEDVGFHLLVPAQLHLANETVSISAEILPQLKADWIIVMASGNSQVKQIQQTWEENSILRSLPAYQQHRVYFVDYQLWSRITGPIAAELVLNEIQNMLRLEKTISH
jgi:iron complex transport system substrate-binding protein